MIKTPGAYKGDSPSPAFPSSSSSTLPPPSLSLFPATPEQHSNFLAHLNTSSHGPPQALVSHLSSKSLQPAPRWYTDPPPWPDQQGSHPGLSPQHHHQQPPPPLRQPQPPSSWIKEQHSIFSSSPSPAPFLPAPAPSHHHQRLPVVPVAPLPAQGHGHDAMAPAPNPFLSPFLSTFSGPSLSELQHLQQLTNRLPAPKLPSNPAVPAPAADGRHGGANSNHSHMSNPSNMDPLFHQHANRFSSMQSQLQLRSPGFADASACAPQPPPASSIQAYANYPPPPDRISLPPFSSAPPNSTTGLLPNFFPSFLMSRQQQAPAPMSQPPAITNNAFPTSPAPSLAISGVPLTTSPPFVDPSFAACAQQLQSEDRGLYLIKLLLSCADAASSTNMSLTNQMLEQLSHLSNLTGDPMQRVATYFMKGLAARVTKAVCPGIYKALNSTHMPSLPDLLAARQVFFGVCPYLKFAFLAVNQAIMDAMQGNKLVHVVDLEAIDAVQWVALLQALATRPGGPPHLRISGVSERRDLLDKLGQQLTDEAHRLGVPFQFHAIVVRVEDLTKEMLRLKQGEALAVSSVMKLHLLLAVDEECHVPMPRSTIAVGEKQSRPPTSQGGRDNSAFTFHKPSVKEEPLPAVPKKTNSCGSGRVDVGLNLSGASNSSNSGTSFKAPSGERNGFIAWAPKNESGIRSSADSGPIVKRESVDQAEDSGHGSGFSLWGPSREKEVLSRRSPSYCEDDSKRKQEIPGRSEQRGQDTGAKHFLSSCHGGQQNGSPQRSGLVNHMMEQRKGKDENDQNGEVERSRAGTGDTSGTDVSTVTEEGSPDPERLLQDEKRDLVQRLYNAKHALLEKVHGGLDMNRRSAEQNDSCYGTGGDSALDMNKSNSTAMNKGPSNGGSHGTGKGNHWIAPGGGGIDVNKASEESEEERRGGIDINRCFDKGQGMTIDMNSIVGVGPQSVQISRGDNVVGHNQTLPFQLESDRGVKRGREQMEEEWNLSKRGGDECKGGGPLFGFTGNSQRENDSRSAALSFHQERQLMAERGYPSVLAVGHYAGDKPMSVKQEPSTMKVGESNGGQPHRGLMSALTGRPGGISSPSSKCSRNSYDEDNQKVGWPFSLDHVARKGVKDEVNPEAYLSRTRFEGMIAAAKEEYPGVANSAAGVSLKGKDFSAAGVSENGHPQPQANSFPRSSSRPAIGRVLQMLKSLHPKVMVVVEQDSSHNSSSLVERFVQALHYYGAMFDSLDSTLSQQSPERVILEKHLLGQEIHNIVACEGRDRLERHEKLEVWKRRMDGAGFQPLLFSQTTSVQAQRLLRNCFSDGYRMVEENGCLTLCWKNTPLFSASAWHSDSVVRA